MKEQKEQSIKDNNSSNQENLKLIQEKASINNQLNLIKEEKRITIEEIKQHPFYHEKVDTLVGYGIPVADEAYFDSKWDECLKPMCRKWYKVKDGKVVESGTNEL